MAYRQMTPIERADIRWRVISVSTALACTLVGFIINYLNNDLVWLMMTGFIMIVCVMTLMLDLKEIRDR